MKRSPMKRTGIKRKQAITDRTVKVVKRMKQSAGKPATAAEKRHLGKVAALGCIVCSHCLGIHGTPAIVHHIRSGQGKSRAPHTMTLPLCPDHHQFSGFGVHDIGRAEFEQMYGISEVGLLLIVLEILGLPIDSEIAELNQRFSNLPLKEVNTCSKSMMYQSAHA
jgi:hypothetical protein